MLRKIMSLLIVACMLLSLSACATKEPSAEVTDTPISSEAATEDVSSDEAISSQTEDVSSDEAISSQTETQNVSSKTPSVESKPTHTHKYSNATCTSAAKCSCGATNGSALGHSYSGKTCSRCGASNPNYKEPTSSKAPTHTHKYSNATCTSAAKCSCGATNGSALGHLYSGKTCSRCGTKNPNYIEPSSSKIQENKPILTGISVVYVGKKLKVGDILKNSDFEVVANYSDKEQIKVTDFTIDVTKLQKVGNNTVTITYKNKSYSINLNVFEGNPPNANPGGEFGYEIYDGELTITTYVGAKTDVVVPSWIDDMPVTCIEWLSEKITSVVLPNSITRIQRKAFCDCDELVSVTIGPNVVEMGDNIFYHCDKLKNVTIKTGATLIGDGMFSGCPSIESIVLPKTITTIEMWAFSSCENLKSIYIPASVTSIAENNVFSFSYNLQNIIVEQGSYAQRWCLNNGYGEKLKFN